MPSSPEPPLLPSFVSLSEFVNLALFGDARYRQALVLSYSHFSSAKEVIELLKNKFLEEEEKVCSFFSSFLFDLIQFDSI